MQADPELGEDANQLAQNQTDELTNCNKLTD